MPRISIVATLDGGTDQATKLFKTIKRQSLDDYELIVVAPKPQLYRSALDELELSASMVGCNGNAGAMRMAGLEEASGDYVYFADSSIMLAGGFVKILLSQLERFPSEIGAFHLQAYDTTAHHYTSTRPTDKHGMNLAAFNPSSRAATAFKKLSGQVANKVFYTDFLKDAGGKFSGEFTYDDDPYVLELIMKSESASYNPWPLAVRSYNRPGVVELTGFERYSDRYKAPFSSISIFGSGELDKFKHSFACWLIDYVFEDFEDAGEDTRAGILGIAESKLVPAVKQLVGENEADPLVCKHSDLFELASMSKVDLLQLAMDNEEQSLENRYELMRYKMMYQRALRKIAASSNPARFAEEPAKRKSLFRR